jgi:3-oxoacyl-[acyl-carrier protein] reductase
MRLENRVALVTGSTQGIGKAIAQRLAADGAKVILHGRDRAKAEAVAQEIPESVCLLGDLTEGETAADLVRQAFAVHGALDVLVLNAGGG